MRIEIIRTGTKTEFIDLDSDRRVAITDAERVRGGYSVETLVWSQGSSSYIRCGMRRFDLRAEAVYEALCRLEDRS